MKEGEEALVVALQGGCWGLVGQGVGQGGLQLGMASQEGGVWDEEEQGRANQMGVAPGVAPGVGTRTL